MQATSMLRDVLCATSCPTLLTLSGLNRRRLFPRPLWEGVSSGVTRLSNAPSLWPLPHTSPPESRRARTIARCDSTLPELDITVASVPCAPPSDKVFQLPAPPIHTRSGPVSGFVASLLNLSTSHRTKVQLIKVAWILRPSGLCSTIVSVSTGGV